MFPTRIIKWLTLIGTLAASYITLPKLWINTGNGQVFRLEQDLPTWALGLLVVIVIVLVFKVVTHMLFRLLLWGAIAVIVLMLLNSANVPVFEWIGAVAK